MMHVNHIYQYKGNKMSRIRTILQKIQNPEPLKEGKISPEQLRSFMKQMSVDIEAMYFKMVKVGGMWNSLEENSMTLGQYEELRQDADDLLAKEYPFSKSYDELLKDVKNWSDDVKKQVKFL